MHVLYGSIHESLLVSPSKWSTYGILNVSSELLSLCQQKTCDGFYIPSTCIPKKHTKQNKHIHILKIIDIDGCVFLLHHLLPLKSIPRNHAIELQQTRVVDVFPQSPTMTKFSASWGRNVFLEEKVGEKYGKNHQRYSNMFLVFFLKKTWKITMI